MTVGRSLRFAQCAPPQLIEFDGFEQGFEIAFAKALVAFALNDFEEERPDNGI